MSRRSVPATCDDTAVIASCARSNASTTRCVRPPEVGSVPTIRTVSTSNSTSPTRTAMT
ncbi:hypothetical protein [Actinoplanes sichuanensis]|uniref:Uncharacterized protein n=1 Tax=Actinoplanes sichuanensis TaxID=512349 RepID=A0ABW4AIE7_9ACTN|nr:hypothetical protein [Actinoplanes sichuanensis]